MYSDWTALFLHFSLLYTFSLFFPCFTIVASWRNVVRQKQYPFSNWIRLIVLQVISIEVDFILPQNVANLQPAHICHLTLSLLQFSFRYHSYVYFNV